MDYETMLPTTIRTALASEAAANAAAAAVQEKGRIGARYRAAAMVSQSVVELGRFVTKNLTPARNQYGIKFRGAARG